VQLLFGTADPVTVRMQAAIIAPTGVGDVLARTASTDRLDARVDRVALATLTARDVTLLKEGPDLVGTGRVDEGAVAAALPPPLDVRAVPAAGGPGVLFEGGVSLFGARVGVRARLTARNGQLVLEPEGLAGALGTFTLFDDPRVAVRDIAATSVPGGMRFEVRGELTE